MQVSYAKFYDDLLSQSIPQTKTEESAITY
jgi:hypothetical protein